MEEKIRPIYEELQGLLSQAPIVREGVPDDVSFNIKDLEYFHSIIKSLESILPKEIFSRFYVNIETSASLGKMFRINEYRQKINGLIMFLHAAYFKGEKPPFSGSPSVVQIQSQEQKQTQTQSQVQAQEQRQFKVMKNLYPLIFIILGAVYFILTNLGRKYLIKNITWRNWNLGDAPIFIEEIILGLTFLILIWFLIFYFSRVEKSLSLKLEKTLIIMAVAIPVFIFLIQGAQTNIDKHDLIKGTNSYNCNLAEITPSILQGPGITFGRFITDAYTQNLGFIYKKYGEAIFASTTQAIYDMNYFNSLIDIMPFVENRTTIGTQMAVFAKRINEGFCDLEPW